jgi:predicted Abi (CAAX) family protease
MFGAPTLAHIPAGSTRTVNYALFLARVPEGSRSIADVVVKRDSLELVSHSGGVISSLRANVIREYLC